MKREGLTQIAFRLNDALARQFKSECALRGETLQVVLNRAVEEYVKHDEKAKNKPE